MRFLHVSDTHVGFSQFHRVTPEGLNVREQDFYRSFRSAVDLAIERRVDLVLHTGDLFDSVRPSNRALSFAMSEIQRLDQAGIPFLVLSGNHETPRLRETGSVFRVLEVLPNVRAAYRGRREVFRVGEAAFHLIPHLPETEGVLREIEEASPDPKARWNVLGLHAAIVGIEESEAFEFNEVALPSSVLREDFDAVTLGHIHRRIDVTENSWYAGSTERTSLREAGEEKGVVLVDLEKGRREFLPVPTRRMVALPPVDLAGVPEERILATILGALDGVDPTDAIVHLRLTHLPRHVRRTLDLGRIRKSLEGALHLQIEVEYEEGEEPGMVSGPFGTLREEFESFLSRTAVGEEGVRGKLLSKGQEYLARADRGDEG